MPERCPLCRTEAESLALHLAADHLRRCGQGGAWCVCGEPFMMDALGIMFFGDHLEKNGGATAHILANALGVGW